MVASDGPLVYQYLQAMNGGNAAQANQILAQIPSASRKLIQAQDLNKLTQAILAVERFYHSDIEDYVSEQEQNWLNIINRFHYEGDWDAGTTYQQNNIVSYVVGGLTFLYLATSNPPVGTLPTNTTYWRVLTMRGQQGISGVGLSYRQAWVNSNVYEINDAVTHDGGLWMSLQDNNQGVVPGTNNQIWRLIMTLDATIYPIRDTPPTVQGENALWFNTSGTPPAYYRLDTLVNPATAADIAQGKQAYDAYGNVIIGTAT